MVQATTSLSTSPALTRATAAVSLQAQLADYQKKLSDCVNCASAKTPEGKAQIQELSGKISEIRQRMGRLSVPAAAAMASTDAATERNRTAPEPPKRTASTIGSLLDIKA